MSAHRRPLPGITIAALLAIGAGSTACNAILGLGDYAVGGSSDATADSGIANDAQAGDEPDATVTSAPDASDGSPAPDATIPDGSVPPDAATGSDAPNCNADPLTFTDPAQCYACTPTTSPQFANACTNSTCVPFDDTRLTNLLADGALPPVPLKDASSD